MERLDFKSKISRFGLNLSNRSSDWVQWTRNPFLDMPKGTENPFLDSKSGFGFWPKERTLCNIVLIAFVALPVHK